MYQKFVMGSLGARQEQDWYRLGLTISRSNMANWIVRCCQEWLSPVYDKIHQSLLTLDNILMDETRNQVNKEKGKTYHNLRVCQKPAKYLETFLEDERLQISNNHLIYPEIIDKYLPWSDQPPEVYKLR